MFFIYSTAVYIQSIKILGWSKKLSDFFVVLGLSWTTDNSLLSTISTIRIRVRVKVRVRVESLPIDPNPNPNCFFVKIILFLI